MSAGIGIPGGGAPPLISTRKLDLMLVTAGQGFSVGSNPAFAIVQRGGGAAITNYGFQNSFNGQPCLLVDGRLVAHGKTLAAAGGRDTVTLTLLAQATSALLSAGTLLGWAEKDGVWIYRMLVGVPVGGFTDSLALGEVGVLVIPQRAGAGFVYAAGPFGGSPTSAPPGVGILQAGGKWQWVVRQSFNNTSLPPDMVLSIDGVMSSLHPNGTIRLWEFRFYPATASAPAFMQFYVNGTLVAAPKFGVGSIGGLATPIGPGNVNGNNQSCEGSAVIPVAGSFAGGTVPAELYLGSYDVITGPNLPSTL